MTGPGRGLALAVVLLHGAGVAAAQVAAPPAARSHPMVDALFVLAADSMEGRAVGTAGGARARRFLLSQLRSIGVAPVGGSFEHPFEFTTRQGVAVEGVNLLAQVRGTTHPDRFLVVSAHYDHVGVRNGEIYNGADDNASGTAALLELARRLRAAPLGHSVILAFFDAEESGLRGAAAFVAAPPVPKEAIAMNLNMDMVSRSEASVLWAAGTAPYPQFRPILLGIEPVPGVTLKLGHDTDADGPSNNWTSQSDQGAFHRAGIPFLYFGVEDHPGYHKPTDDAEAVTHQFYIGAVETIWRALVRVDAGIGARSEK